MITLGRRTERLIDRLIREAHGDVSVVYAAFDHCVVDGVVNITDVEKWIDTYNVTLYGQSSVDF